MRTVSVTLNSVTGIVTININDDKSGMQKITLRWGDRLNGDHGFKVDFHPGFIRLTEPAAAIFLGQFITIIVNILNIDDDDLNIINDRGEQLNEIQFLPPTFEGGADEISEFTQLQEVLAGAHHVFETTGRRLTAKYLEACDEQGILEDFLSLVESKLAGIHFNLDCLSAEENHHG